MLADSGADVFFCHFFPILRSPGVFGGRGLDALPPDDKVITGKSNTCTLKIMCVQRRVTTQLAENIAPQGVGSDTIPADLTTVGPS